MKWAEFLKKIGDLSVVETEILLAGVADPRPIKVQISRWQKSGKLIQLKRGIYLLSEPYRKQQINELYLASILNRPSYISLEKALEYYDMIPEAVKVYTSVTTKRPCKFISEIGIFSYRHLKKSLFWGYSSKKVDKQTVFIALPEKALLDFFYLNGMKISLDYLVELRLQNIERIDLEKLLEFAGRFSKPGMLQAASMVKEYVRSHKNKDRLL